MKRTWFVLLCAWSWAAQAQEGALDASNDNIDTSYSLHSDDAPVGIITTYINKTQIETPNALLVNPGTESQYSSFGIGPSVKLGDYVTSRSSYQTAIPVQALTLDNDSRMYGVGMQIRPTQDWQIDMKYQNANLNSGADSSRQVNYFNVGIGYKFW